ncbi:hypothetical protein MAPG_08380 [Magnaporthiopsis poae ATCC 64411]|uniref:AB hydrolase-1 domain-containing protein n=1 Tax=Magnaporthiopsis poae (strain ATCC 64411 / 73-15) TaxID=644358 RepID=A0A0C4E777_MAGP6|nr:hypothetical protein MAPG_08380 [Magnaporthiopsis poae ATCC 64411]
MFNLHLTYKWLRWTRPTAPPPPLPDGVERFFTKTSSGDLEMLYAAPVTDGTKPSPAPKPILFVHGGMGSAWVWLEYMQYLSARGIPCYAVSLRGHGESWHPSYLRMVYGTRRLDLANDVVAALRAIQFHDASVDAAALEVVLVGHSSGGGLSQYILQAPWLAKLRPPRICGLALLGAVPGFGSLGVYVNWWRVDPLFGIRMLLHGWHPNSALSHPALTKRVFFSDEVDDDYVLRFQARTSAYESFLWPLSMMRRFVDPARLLCRLWGWTSSSDGSGSSTRSGQRILIMSGEGDKLMTPPVMRHLAATYRAAFADQANAKKIEVGHDSAEVVPLAGEGGVDDAGQGVRFCIAPGAGHHLQNDVEWEVGARKLLEFYKQL